MRGHWNIVTEDFTLFQRNLQDFKRDSKQCGQQLAEVQKQLKKIRCDANDLAQEGMCLKLFAKDIEKQLKVFDEKFYALEDDCKVQSEVMKELLEVERAVITKATLEVMASTGSSDDDAIIVPDTPPCTREQNDDPIEEFDTDEATLPTPSPPPTQPSKRVGIPTLKVKKMGFRLQDFCNSDNYRIFPMNSKYRKN